MPLVRLHAGINLAGKEVVLMLVGVLWSYFLLSLATANVDPADGHAFEHVARNEHCVPQAGFVLAEVNRTGAAVFKVFNAALEGTHRSIGQGLFPKQCANNLRHPTFSVGRVNWSRHSFWGSKSHSRPYPQELAGLAALLPLSDSSSVPLFEFRSWGLDGEVWRVYTRSGAKQNKPHLRGAHESMLLVMAFFLAAVVGTGTCPKRCLCHVCVLILRGYSRVAGCGLTLHSCTFLPAPQTGRFAATATLAGFDHRAGGLIAVSINGLGGVTR